MKASPFIQLRPRSGMTLIELSVVILVLFLFLGMTFMGVRGWKRGADRAACVLNIRHVQQAVRGFANAYNLNPGADTQSMAPPVALATELIGSGSYLPSAPRCPGQGLYTFGGNLIPQPGSLYASCSLGAVEGHQPEEFSSW